ncbi:MAG: D-aminoacylase [Anaerotignum sp.]|nr:D-aminoacylase [Anaerotignum sp.]
MFQTLIKGAMIVDGTGAPEFQGDIGIQDGKLHVLEANSNAPAENIIDATGLYVTPGFIDAHAHGDSTYGHDYNYLSKISQGITTQVTGHCGQSLFPIHPDTMAMLQHEQKIQTNEFPEEMITFTNCENFMKFAETVKHPENIVFMVGHVALRNAVMGFDDRKPTEAEMEQMKSMLREAMENGAAGFSTGLIYVPCSYAEEDEIVELCKVVAEYDGIYTTHMRNESTKVYEAIEEAISVAKKSGVRLQISHLKIATVEKWGDSVRILDLIHRAKEEGVRITADQYPYTASSTHLYVCVPPKYFNEGIEKVAELLQDPVMRETIKKEMYDPATPYDNYYLNAGGWKGIFISSAAATPDAEGKTIAEYAEEKGIDGFDAFCEIMIANDCIAPSIYFCISEEDLFRIAKDENVVVGTDAIPKSFVERTHPRAYGAFPRAIRYYVKENGILTLPEMIRKMTSKTAEIYQLAGKGMIADGYDADPVIFDYGKITDTADFMHPLTKAEGIEYVLVNGEVVYKDMELTGAMPGKVIRFNQKV